MSTASRPNGQKIYSVLAWIAGFFLSVGVAHAATPMTLLVWYPGSGGTATTAGPLMDRWAAYLSAHTPGISWTIHFAGTESEGRQLLRAKRPDFVLPSHLMLVRHALFGPVIATSIPGLLGKRTEQWYFVHNHCAQPTTIFSSEPIDKVFIANFFATIVVKAPLEATGNLVGVLRRMQAGECIGAYVNEREWTNSTHALPQLTKDLVAEASARPMPTPTVMARRDSANAALGAALRTALTGMSHDTEGKAILQELQLAKFE